VKCKKSSSTINHLGHSQLQLHRQVLRA